MSDAAPIHSSEMRFRAYFDSSPDCMFHVRVEPDGRFTYVDVNAAGLEAAGLRIDDMRGREPLKILGPEKGAEMTEALGKVVETGEPYSYEPSWDMETGRIVYDAVYIPLRDDAGAVTGVLGTARNINERKNIEAALHQARKVEVIGQLASGIAHDFNNFLAAFDSCLRLLDTEMHSERGRMLLAEAQLALGRGKALTTWLTGFMRKGPVVIETIDLNMAIWPMRSMIEQCLSTGISLHLDLGTAPLLASADKNEIGLAIVNLALNARDAMPDGGTLCLSTRSEVVAEDHPSGVSPGVYAVVDVEDTGTGMPPEVAEHVLEPFFTTKPAGKGTGLGLSMVARIVRRAGGGLMIDSEDGEGTCISLLFPAGGTES